MSTQTNEDIIERLIEENPLQISLEVKSGNKLLYFGVADNIDDISDLLLKADDKYRTFINIKFAELEVVE